MRTSVDDDAVFAATSAGDESAFGTLAERNRRELDVHYYRMLGSFHEAEDLGDSEFRAFKIDVLRIKDGLIAEITTFNADLFPQFGLTATL
jgi:RNA polymerase sigma-70 factor (ECF subfamily)